MITCRKNLKWDFKFLGKVVDEVQTPAIMGGSQREKSSDTGAKRFKVKCLEKGLDEAVKGRHNVRLTSTETSRHEGRR